MRPSIYSTCLLVSVILLPLCLSRDTITVGTITYPGGNTLVSAGGRFELGFFSPNGSSDSRRYVGIWYYRSDPSIIVWVAKRDDPLFGHTWFGLVGGNLQLGNETRSIWLTNVEGSNSSTRFAKLLDSGNLVLVEGENTLWQSFDHPTDTLLLGMRLTKGFKLTSWASHDDPKQGNFTFQRDTEGDPGRYEVILGKLSAYWKSGVYDKFIQTDPMWYIISFLLDNLSTDTTATSLPPATSPTLAYKNINRSDYDYNDTRLVMNYSGQIQYFKPGNGSKPVWFNPAGQCNVFNACGKFGSCNSYNGNKNMCRCLPGFKPEEQDNWNLREYSDGCKRKSPICQKNNDNRANHFLSLKMMKAGNPDNLIMVGSEEECKQNCLDVCGCQAYSLEERQRRGTESLSLTCYIWSKELDNMQEFVPDGHSLSVRVLLSDIEPTKKSCGACGTNLVPYPLSTGESCGDPLYSAFRCDNDTAQLDFEWHRSGYRVTSIHPKDRTFTIQVGDAFNCTSSRLTEFNQQSKQTSPFSVISRCIGGQNDFSSEMKIKWRDPAEPLCNSSKDCDWPHATCKYASGATKRCLCNPGFSWNSLSVNCSLGENVDLAN